MANNLKCSERKYYVRDVDLVYEIVLSKGLGYPSKKLEYMMYLIINRIALKLKYKDIQDMFDCMQTAYLQLHTKYQSFDENKYYYGLSYISELAKRGLAAGFNELQNGYNLNNKKLGFNSNATCSLNNCFF